MMRFLVRIMPHVTIVLSAVFIVFLILDAYNPTMYFIDNEISNILLWALCISALANAVLLIIKDRKGADNITERKQQKQKVSYKYDK